MLRELLEKKKLELKSEDVQEEIKTVIESYVSQKIKNLFLSNFFTIGSLFKNTIKGTDEEQTKVIQLLFAFSYACLAGQGAVNRIMFGVPIEISDNIVKTSFSEVVYVNRPEEPPTPKKLSLSVFSTYINVIKEINTNLELDHLKMVSDFDSICTDHFNNDPRAALHYASHLFESTLVVYTRLSATLLLRALSDVNSASILETFNKLYMKSKIKQMKVINKQFDNLIITEDTYTGETAIDEKIIDSSGIFKEVKNDDITNLYCQEALLRKCETSNVKIIDESITGNFKHLSKHLNIHFKAARSKVNPSKFYMN
jgi:hypothetical protein